jgi:hypothetical protein
MKFVTTIGAQTIAVLLVSAAGLLSQPAPGSCGTDLTPQFAIQPGPLSTKSGLSKQSLLLTNHGAVTKGTVYLAVYGLPAGITPIDFTWNSGCTALPGAYFFRIYLGYQNQWDANATLRVALQFSNPDNQPFTFTYQVLKGDVLPNPHAVPGDFDGDGRPISPYTCRKPPPGSSGIPRATPSPTWSLVCRSRTASCSAISTAI